MKCLAPLIAVRWMSCLILLVASLSVIMPAGVGYCRQWPDDRQSQPRAGGILGAIGVTTSSHAIPFEQSDVAGETREVHAVADGTGWMVSPCLLLTNFHAVFGVVKRPYEMPDPAKVHELYLRIGSGGAKGFRSFGLNGQIKGRVVAFGDFLRLQDWALVHFDDCPGAKPGIGWIELDSPDPISKLPLRVSSFGYPLDRPKYSEVYGQTTCDVLEIAGDFIFHNCIINPAASGAPILREKSGRLVAIGLAIGGAKKGPRLTLDEPYDRVRASAAISISAIRSAIPLDDMIKADIVLSKVSNTAYEDR